MSSPEAVRTNAGSVLFSHGFRPFFFMSAVSAVVMIAVWIPAFLGMIRVPGALPPLAWHTHELLFGYLSAAIAGFLLTSIPSWTKSQRVMGWRLAGLVGLWLAARVAVAASAFIGIIPALLIGLLFPMALTAYAARAIFAAGNSRNFVVVLVLLVYLSGQSLFFVEVAETGFVLYGPRVGIAAALMLIMVIGGRITPNFTANWLRQRQETRLPAPHDRFDTLCLIAGGLGLAVWVASADLLAGNALVGTSCVLIGSLHLWRQSRWRPLRVLKEPLLSVLHLGYVFVGLGFLLVGARHWTDAPALDVAAIHTWTIGAIGLTTLGVMTRATRGHTGRPLSASLATTMIYVAIIAAVIARVIAAMMPELTLAMLWVSAAFWVAAFLGFCLEYGRALLLPAKA